MTPLISVVMPLFNAADTITMALASLQAQTWEDWECVIVDDGSTDNPEIVIQMIGDSRIQYHSLGRNRGRGYARQHALEIVRGKYVTFLDADDWIYPAKLRDQLKLFETSPALAIVSTGMAISDASDQLIGVRNVDADESIFRPPMKTPGMPPVPFAPSMLTTELAKHTGFDPSFPIAEDTDFLLRALLGRRYAILPAPLYVYRWQGSATPNTVNSALHYCSRMFGKQFARYPLHSVKEIAKARAKLMIYYAAATFGIWDYMISRRSQTPNADDYEQYQNAWQIVSGIAARFAPTI